MADVPLLGASANLTFLGISVLKTNVGKCFSSSSETSLAKLFLISTIVLTIPNTLLFVRFLFLSVLMVFISDDMPSKE